MKERIFDGYDNFVLPFMIGMIFILIYLGIGLIRLIKHIPHNDRKKLLFSFFNPKIMFNNVKDIINDCLLHTKIFKRKALLGFMHASIAFGWFMLIIIGHIEVALYVPQRNGVLYYPVFFRYFVKEEGDTTLRGSFFFFLMDFFLLLVLCGIGLAVYKRIRSTALGMRRTTQPSFADRVALICLWAIFPLRLLAESFTAGISGGSFLTKPMNWMFASFLGNDMNVLPTWWAYSIALGLFFLALPFSRYMHIPTEALLIVLRNAGLKVTKPRKGFSEAEIYSCSSCGICLDACPMNAQKKNLKFSTVYFIRFLRRHNETKINDIADKCMMCGKCVELCPVGIKSCDIKMAQRATITNNHKYDFAPITKDVQVPDENIQIIPGKVLYFAGCMTHRTPVIIKSMLEIFEKSGQDYIFADKDGGVCCGRPLMLAGKIEAAKELIAANRNHILSSGASTIVLSCPICYKIALEEYNLEGVNVMHHTQYIKQLIDNGKIEVNKEHQKLVYHDPCDLGRGCGVYDAPREVIGKAGVLTSAEKERKESICCGGSIGSLTLSYDDRQKITQNAISNLMANTPEKIITACPLCLKTFNEQAQIPVIDIAQLINENIKNNNN